MLEHLLFFSITRMSKVLDVSRSGFYHWLKHRHKVTSRELARHDLDSKVKQAFVEGKERDGARRIQKALGEDKSPHNIKTISQSMKRQGLVAKAARKFKCTTDITYIATSEGWLYLAVIIDLYSRQVIGWSMNERMTTGLVCDALKMSLNRVSSVAGADQLSKNSMREQIEKRVKYDFW